MCPFQSSPARLMHISSVPIDVSRNKAEVSKMERPRLELYIPAVRQTTEPSTGLITLFILLLLIGQYTSVTFHLKKERTKE